LGCGSFQVVKEMEFPVSWNDELRFIYHIGRDPVSFFFNVLDDFDVHNAISFMEALFNIHHKKTVLELFDSDFTDLLGDKLIDFSSQIVIVKIFPFQNQVIKVGPDVSLLFLYCFDIQSGFVDKNYVFVI
jgi:hypothetical protein